MVRPSGQRDHLEVGWRPKRALQSEWWARVGERALFLLGLAFWSEVGSLLRPVAQVFGPAHQLRAVCLGRAFAGKPVREGPRIYEPDTMRNAFIIYNLYVMKL